MNFLEFGAIREPVSRTFYHDEEDGDEDQKLRYGAMSNRQTVNRSKIAQIHKRHVVKSADCFRKNPNIS